MLNLSSNAATTIRNLVDQPEVPEHAGLRISGTRDGSGQLNVAAASAPEQDDQVIEEQGARVFLEPMAAAVLDDKVLDASVDEEGRVAFFIGSQ